MGKARWIKEEEVNAEALRAQRRVVQDECGILAEPAEFL